MKLYVECNHEDCRNRVLIEFVEMFVDVNEYEQGPVITLDGFAALPHSWRRTEDRQDVLCPAHGQGGKTT